MVEIGVVDLEKQYGEKWKSYIVRPAAVTTGKPLWSVVFGGWWIPKEELAAAMVDIAVNGGEKQTLESAELRQRGQALLNQQ